MSTVPGRPASARASRRTRIIDTAALLLLVSGAAVYMYAEYRMGQLAAGRMQFDRIGSGAGAGLNLGAWQGLVTTSRVGLALAATGLLAGTAGFANHLMERRSAPAHEQADDS